MMPALHSNRYIRIVSGGQTGVDRAALDVALELGLPCGGWCPRGRRAQDGPIPSRYPLRETESEDYRVRTRLNVRDSDATLVLHCGELNGGTAYTVEVARELERPCLAVNLEASDAVTAAVNWLAKHDVGILNVAGPRENDCPGIQEKAGAFVLELMADRSAGAR